MGSVASGLGSAAGALFGSNTPDFKKTDVNKDEYTNSGGFAKQAAFIDQNANRFTNVNAPTMQAATLGAANTIDADNQFRNGQAGLVSQLQATAAGNGPSVARSILQEGTDRTLANQAAMAASRPTTNPALAAKILAGNAVGANQDLAFKAAQMKDQEALNAQNSLGAVLGGARGQDVGIAQANQDALNNFLLQRAGFQQQANANNLNAGITTNAQNLQGALGFGQQLGSQVSNQQGANAAFWNQQIAQDQKAQDEEAQRIKDKNAAMSQAIGGITGAAGSALSMGL